MVWEWNTHYSAIPSYSTTQHVWCTNDTFAEEYSKKVLVVPVHEDAVVWLYTQNQNWHHVPNIANSRRNNYFRTERLNTITSPWSSTMSKDFSVIAERSHLCLVRSPFTPNTRNKYGLDCLYWWKLHWKSVLLCHLCHQHFFEAPQWYHGNDHCQPRESLECCPRDV